jgi:integrase
MAKKRSQGEGSIYKWRSGKWRGLVTDQNGKRLSKISDDKSEIVNWILQTTNQVNSGLTYDAARISVGDYLLHWLASTKNSVRPSTYAYYGIIINNHIIPQLGKILIKELTADRIQYVYDEWIGSGLGIHTVLKIHQVLHSALERSVQTGLLVQNPSHYTKRPKEPDNEMLIWNESEVNRFLVAARDNSQPYSRLYCLFHLALTTGARQSELLGLQWENFDQRSGTLHIQKQLTRTGSGKMFAPLKTRASKRSITLGESDISALREHYEKQQLERRRAGYAWKDNDLIFTTRIGTPMHQKNLLDHYFFPLIRAANVPEIRFHDMRHTAATIMLSHGIPPVIVAGRLGHSLAVSMKTYAHFVPSMQEEAAKLMNDLFISIPIPIESSSFQSRTDRAQIAHKEQNGSHE